MCIFITIQPIARLWCTNFNDISLPVTFVKLHVLDNRMNINTEL